MIQRRAAVRSALFFGIIAITAMAALMLLRQAGSDAASGRSFPANTWVVLKTSGDGAVSQYGAAGLPRFRGWQQASYDLESKEVVIFGGSSSTYMSDTWTFNLDEGVWHIRRPHPDLSGPCRRDNHNLIYDPIGKIHWLFNGISYDNLQPGCGRNIVWTYKRSENQWLKTKVSAGNWRLAPGLAYDSHRGAFFQFGGGAVNLSDSSFIFDIAKREWRAIRTSPKPAPRTNIEGGLVYDTAHKVFVLFGGKGQKGPLGDTWIFDPAAEKWRQVLSPESPAPRDLHAMVYDQSQNVVILFGGRGNKGKLNDTWIFDVGKQTWIQLTDVGNPPALEHQSAVYDPFHHVTIVVDGQRTMVFRYDSSSSKAMTRTSVDHGRTEPGLENQGVASEMKSEAPAGSVQSRPRAENVTSEPARKVVEIAAGVSQEETNSPSYVIDIPANTWIARKLPGFAKGPWGPMKHVRMAFNPRDGRIYLLGGDYSGPGAMQSGRNELYSYSIADNNWRLEYPYCGPRGAVQPSHPDEVGWAFDSRRNIFWMVPGYMGGHQDVCPDSTIIRGQIMTFDPATRTWDLPKRQNSSGQAGNKKFLQYDAAKDQLVRFAWTGEVQSEVYDIQSNTWSIGRHGIGGYQIGQEYSAMDEANRQIYVMSPREGRLNRYDMDKHAMGTIAKLPAKAVNDHTMPIWDSVNRILLWPQIVDRGGLITLFAFDPQKKEWEKLPMSQPEGLTVMGVDAVFDPKQNVLLVLGGVDRGPNPYLFLYRYRK